MLERSEFIETNVDLEPGDAFFLYTDGIYGAGHDENPRLSSNRLGEMLQPMAENAQALLDRVVEQADEQPGRALSIVANALDGLPREKAARLAGKDRRSFFAPTWRRG